MKNQWKVFGMVLFLAGASTLEAKHDAHQKEMKPVEKKSEDRVLKCEVVDVACYIARGAKGEEHQGCAAKCILEGGELALLCEGKLYIPVDANYHSARKLFVSKAGEKVSVTGRRVSKDGLSYLILAEKKK
jgi:hypothetical protein